MEERANREIRKRQNFKYFKKNYMATELMIEGLLEMAPAVKGSDNFDWDNKEMVYFHREEKMKILNFIQKNERKFVDGDKLEALPHMESTVPKTIYVNTQMYNNKPQLRICIMPPKLTDEEKKRGMRQRRALNMSLDWYQVTGFKIWLEESLRKDVRGRIEGTIEAYAVLKGLPDGPEQSIRRIPQMMAPGDLYKWDEATMTVCIGRLYDPSDCIWTYCFKLHEKKKKDKPQNTPPEAPGTSQKGEMRFHKVHGPESSQDGAGETDPSTKGSIQEHQLEKIHNYVGSNDMKYKALISFARAKMGDKSVEILEDFSQEAAELIITNNKL